VVGFSIAIIFGLLFATILQLFFLPIVFLKLEGKKILEQVNQHQ
jgi:multidrug efflux pump subunit AcrB